MRALLSLSQPHLKEEMSSLTFKAKGYLYLMEGPGLHLSAGMPSRKRSKGQARKAKAALDQQHIQIACYHGGYEDVHGDHVVLTFIREFHALCRKTFPKLA